MTGNYLQRVFWCEFTCQHFSRLADHLVQVIKNVTVLTFTRQNCRKRGESIDHQNRAPPVWDRRKHRAPLSLGGLKVRGSAAQAIAEISRRPLICRAGPTTSTQTSRIWFLCEICSHRGVKVSVWLSVDTCLQRQERGDNISLCRYEWINEILGFIPFFFFCKSKAFY